ncbi:hypothetical protein HMPREF1544_09098 [Mucor circinelloides 1006PhL]|uniref:BZIP domain-containing protein n=1 Tax=Mucor circinelloides f. circinelloides (strain 1006PhL) TaxID=1220926 RepID=S2JW94_MUCC1|nr:hypothetical protein HMPREF1544_09098 [Mucor circinelloides 1006PhL]
MLMGYGPIPEEQIQSSDILMENAAVPDLLAENSYNNDGQSGPSSAEEAVLPPTYAALPTTKLEEEPNPFEQSFESVEKSQAQQQQQQQEHLPNLPNVQTMEAAYTNDGNEWDSSLRSGILSPSMLNQPAHTNTTVYNSTTSTFNNTSTTIHQKPAQSKRSRQVSNANSSCSEDSSFIISTPSKPTNKKPRRQKKSSVEQPEDEEKRKNFLERNRIAALKCRQRKKQWLQNLQTKVEYLAADNEQFHMQANALRDEVIRLKTLLMIHKDCPLNPSALQAALSRPIPGIFDPSSSSSPHLTLQRSAMTSSSSISPPSSSSTTAILTTIADTPPI